VKKIKNPSNEGYNSDYFQVETQTKENKIIDQKNNIPKLFIIKGETLGQVLFNHFYTSPNNGLLESTFYLDF